MTEQEQRITVRLRIAHYERLKRAASVAGFSIHATAKQALLLGLQELEKLYRVDDISHQDGADVRRLK